MVEIFPRWAFRFRDGATGSIARDTIYVLRPPRSVYILHSTSGDFASTTKKENEKKKSRIFFFFFGSGYKSKMKNKKGFVSSLFYLI